MAIILKQKRLARQGALKALDFATTRYAPACERLINMAVRACCARSLHGETFICSKKLITLAGLAGP